MLKAIFPLSILILLNSSSCDPKKQDERIRSLEADVKQLKAEVVELKKKQNAAPEHHYELHREGLRTWRFDAATGETCIQLTSEADWKRKEIQSSSCACKDALRRYEQMPSETADERRAAKDYFPEVEFSCGQLKPIASSTIQRQH